MAYIYEIYNDTNPLLHGWNNIIDYASA